jgi:nondiscriminating aspartyl-tRNA synthetase
METTFSQRIFADALGCYIDKEVLLRGWIYRLRVLANTTFVILRDCSGEAQCVAASEKVKALQFKLEDTVEVDGRVRADARSNWGYEVDILQAKVLNRAASPLPFQASSSLALIGQEVLLEYRSLGGAQQIGGQCIPHSGSVAAVLQRIFG